MVMFPIYPAAAATPVSLIPVDNGTEVNSIDPQSKIAALSFAIFQHWNLQILTRQNEIAAHLKDNNVEELKKIYSQISDSPLEKLINLHLLSDREDPAFRMRVISSAELLLHTPNFRLETDKLESWKWVAREVYRLGLKEKKDNARFAYNCYFLAAQAGLAEAQNDLGISYLEGTGIPRNKERAIEWLNKAFHSGSSLAGYHLAFRIFGNDENEKRLSYCKQMAEIYENQYGDVITSAESFTDAQFGYANFGELVPYFSKPLNLCIEMLKSTEDPDFLEGISKVSNFLHCLSKQAQDPIPQSRLDTFSLRIDCMENDNDEQELWNEATDHLYKMIEHGFPYYELRLRSDINSIRYRFNLFPKKACLALKHHFTLVCLELQDIMDEESSDHLAAWLKSSASNKLTRLMYAPNNEDQDPVGIKKICDALPTHPTLQCLLFPDHPCLSEYSDEYCIEEGNLDIVYDAYKSLFNLIGLNPILRELECSYITYDEDLEESKPELFALLHEALQKNASFSLRTTIDAAITIDSTKNLEPGLHVLRLEAIPPFNDVLGQVQALEPLANHPFLKSFSFDGHLPETMLRTFCNLLPVKLAHLKLKGCFSTEVARLIGTHPTLTSLDLHLDYTPEEKHTKDMWLSHFLISNSLREVKMTYKENEYSRDLPIIDRVVRITPRSILDTLTTNNPTLTSLSINEQKLEIPILMKNLQKEKLWGNIALLTRFMRANRTSTFASSILPLIPQINKYHYEVEDKSKEFSLNRFMGTRWFQAETGAAKGIASFSLLNFNSSTSFTSIRTTSTNSENLEDAEYASSSSSTATAAAAAAVPADAATNARKRRLLRID